MSKKHKLTLVGALGQEMTDKRIDILRRIGEVGSISEAARGASVSYKAAWQAIETLSNLAGAVLVERVVGGSGGGGAQLTKAGQRLLHASDTLNAARNTALQKLRLEGGQDAGLSALGLRTSMRNQLPCTVKKLQKKGPLIRVELVLANGASLYSRITRESSELLGLQSDKPVLALCKATAVLVAKSIEQRAAYNLLQGKITRITAYNSGYEIALELMPGLQLVGFTDSAEGLKLHESAMVTLEESAVVIAISG